MNRVGRIVWITLGLVAAGMVLGAISGAIAFSIAAIITEGPSAAVDPSVLLIGALFGAPLGGISGPAVAWLALRRVPLGRMFIGSVFGTVVGGVLGWTLGPGYAPMGTALLGALLGFLSAAGLMRRAARLRAVLPS